MGARTLFLFIKPPGMGSLEARLRDRGSEDLDSLSRRLEGAKAEMAAADDADLVTEVIVNDDLTQAYADLCAALSKHLGAPVEPQAAGGDAQQERSEAAAVAPVGDAAAAAGADDGLFGVAGVTGTSSADGGAAGSSATAVAAAEAPAAAEAGPSSSQPDTTQYLNTTVVLPLKQAMLALNEARPADPLQFLIDELSRIHTEQAAPAASREAAEPSLL